MNDMHRPRPEFVETLGREMEFAHRRAEAFANGKPLGGAVRSRGRWRLFACVGVIAAASMCVGGAGAFAVVKKREAQMADLNIAKAKTVLEYAHLQIEMYSDEFERMRNLVEAGQATERDLAAMKYELHTAHLSERMRQVDLEEVIATGFEADNSLTAPLVDRRDFVMERLELERQIATGRMEVLHAEFGRSEMDPNTKRALMAEVSNREEAIKSVDERIDLRQQFLDGEVSAADLGWHHMYQDVVRREREAANYVERAHAALKEQQALVDEEMGDEMTLRAMEYETRTAELHLRLAQLEVEAAKRRIEQGRGEDQ